MLTVVNQNDKYKVVKNHKGTLVFSFQIHDKHNPLNPLLRNMNGEAVTFNTKWQADKYIGAVPQAPVKETKAAKDYSQYTGSSHK